MPWRKLWLLFTVIWVVVCGLSAGTILLVGEEPEKSTRQIVLAIAVPAVLYGVGLLWDLWKRTRKPG